ncbi:uncharacterized protein MELLADRAFT_90089 [Melampsora larici-populina 98AG31]|uniref:Uncharacterized protein n=1 Tax=Melampsora larici-populina (strain 98AG31 / pathotype 3-4-7) TaxID=747676 RepID=F4RVM2_MELLP|nr:uncharacterized protein MELLADRAFT_90089 [Melampsora larici-populina 98AG31]EGG03556.1 hypothetical protein MELLADRAFT_90089 [Melampsora larici-populina 98AG31]
MSSQITGTQITPGPSNSSGKKRRLDEETQTEDDQNNPPAHTDSDDEESSDGDLTQQDLLDRKRKRAAKLKVSAEIRHRDEGIGKIAGAHLVPKAATPLARAIQEFTRMLMGIPRKSRGTSALENAGVPKLPDPPSDEERNAWLNRKQVRETYIRESQDKAMEQYIKKKGPDFKPNRKQKKAIEKDAAEMAALKKPMQPVIFKSRMLSNARTRYPHHFISQCEATLAMAGFPRCTFDWGAPYDSPWNSATCTIILSHWVKAYEANGAKDFGILVKDNTAANREEVSDAGTPAGQKTLEEKIVKTQSITNKRLNKTKIYEARLANAARLFGQDLAEFEMLSHHDIHSDDELVTTNSCGSRQKLRLEWRSSELDTLISLLDQAHWKRKRIPKDIRHAKQLVERGVYAPTPDKDRFPPKGFQLSLISPGWYDLQDGLTLEELELNENHPVNIRNAIQDVMRSFSSWDSLAAEEAAQSESRSMVG